MEVYRITRKKFSDTLQASGTASRWNFDNQWVIYAAASRSLATLELIVQRSAVQPSIPYKVMVIALPDDPKYYTQYTQKELPDRWRSIKAYSRLQELGSKWYKEQKSLVLDVPSAVIPAEKNFIINTRHPDFNDHVQLVRQEDYFWEERLL